MEEDQASQIALCPTEVYLESNIITSCQNPVGGAHAKASGRTVKKNVHKR